MWQQLNRHRWRIVYGIGCLLYMAWVVHLSFNNFDMVHSDYRRAGERMRPARIEAAALRELTDNCRAALVRSGLHLSAADIDAACRSFPEADLAARRMAVGKRLASERRLAGRKMVLFYLSFGLFFLVLPPVILYFLLSLFAWLLKMLKTGP